MIKHIVMWKVKEGEDRDQVVAKFQSMLDYLGTQTDLMRNPHIGVNKKGGDFFHFCIDVSFDSMEDLMTYDQHPDHLKIRAYLDTVTGDKTVFDYEY